MGGPVVIAHGTDEQKQRYLEPILTGEEIWCQGFSEPESGSDLASLKTKAVKDGDEWVVTGQKVWTTFAQYAKWCMLVARTDPDAPKHQGLTYFLMDMEQDGVQVRPLVQITGEGEFNEVFIEEARIPDANVIGGVGNGWQVAITTLMNERAGLAFGAIAQIHNSLSRLAELAAETRVNGGTAADDSYFRQRIAQLYIEAETMRLNAYRGLTKTMQSRHPRARGLARQVAVGRHQPGDHRAGARHRGRLRAARPRLRARGRRRRLAVRVPALARQLDRGRHHRHPQEHHRRAGPRPAEAALGATPCTSTSPTSSRRSSRPPSEFLAARYKSRADPRAGRQRARLRATSDWEEMAELGWTGLALPEEWGGQGLGIVDLAVLFEEMGYALAPSPLLSNTVAGLALAACGSDEQRERWLRPLAEGELRGTAALFDAGSPATIGEFEMEAEADGDGVVLDGEKVLVMDAGARRLLPRRHRRRPPPPGRARRRGRHRHRRSPRSTRPGASTRSASTGSRSAPRTRCPASGDDYLPVFHRVCVALAAESTGIAQRTMEMAVEYAKDRQQFGRPIGAYQAVSHRCAQMLLETENSRSAVYGAAWAADAEPESLPLAASMAKAYASDAGWRVARRLDPGPRRHRLHLGARPPLLPQARRRRTRRSSATPSGTASGSPTRSSPPRRRAGRRLSRWARSTASPSPRSAPRSPTSRRRR